MIRSVASILAALNAVAPSFPEKPAAAAHVRELADAGGFDPYTMLAYVEHESRWDPAAVGDFTAGDMIGLGQIRLQNYPVCWAGAGDAKACGDVRESLLDWRHNLTETARVFSWWRGYCTEKVGRGDARFWLQGPMGWDAVRHTTCGHRKGKALPVPAAVLKLLKRRAALAARF